MKELTDQIHDWLDNNGDKVSKLDLIDVLLQIVARIEQLEDQARHFSRTQYKEF